MAVNEIDHLNLQLAFANWAEDRGYDLGKDDAGDFANVETRSAWLGFEAAHGPDGCKPQGQQLFAQIKKSSEYAHQSDKLFPVRVGTPPYSDYAVQGGPGGVYRLRDVNFYVIEDGKQYRLN